MGLKLGTWLMCLQRLFTVVLSVDYDVVLSGAEFAQRSLSWDLPLDQAFSTWIGTHNSYNFKSTASSVFENPHNQNRTITEQLNLGARYIELDPHSIRLNQTATSATTLVCHTDPFVAAVIREQCANQWTRCEILGIRDYGENTGCNPSASTLESSINEIYSWQQKNSRELLVLYLDADVTSEIERTIVATIGRSHIFASQDFNGTWPSPRTLVKNGITTILMGNSATTIAFKQFPNVHSANSVQNVPCPAKAPWGRVQADATNVRIGSTVYYNGSEQVGTISPSDVRRLQDCGLAVLMDLFNETYLSAALWAWQADPPIYKGDRICAGLSLTQGWKTASCKEEFFTSCRDANGNQLLLSSNKTAAIEKPVCPSGSIPSTPVMSSENSNLIASMKKRNISFVWINVWSDKEGCWQRVDGDGPICDRPRLHMNPLENSPSDRNQGANISISFFIVSIAISLIHIFY